jgi:cell division protease FtsH
MSGVAEETLNAVDQEARRLIDEAYQRAIALLSENRQRLDNIVVQLLEHETLDETDVYAAAGIPRPTVKSEPVVAGVLDPSPAQPSLSR